MRNSRRRVTSLGSRRLCLLFSLLALTTTIINLRTTPGSNLNEANPDLRTSPSPCFMPPGVKSKFSPKSFMELGEGKQFLSLYERQLNLTRQRLLKYRLVQFDMNENCRPVYWHIHKNGGSTMNLQNTTGVHAYYTPEQRTMGTPNFLRETNRIIQQVYQIPNQNVMFSFLRDPIPRFLSSVGQALRLNKVAPCNQQYRGDGETLGLLECILTQIEKRESFLDEHLVPQAFELYHGVMGLEIPVYLMDLTSIGSVIQAMGYDVSEATRRRSSGFERGYNLSLARLTPSLKARICETYRVDVLLLQKTRVTNTECIALQLDKVA